MWVERVSEKVAAYLPLRPLDLVRVVVTYLPKPALFGKTVFYTRDESLKMESEDPIDLSDPTNRSFYGCTPITRRDFRAIAYLWVLFPSGLVLQWGVGSVWRVGFQWLVDIPISASSQLFLSIAGHGLGPLYVCAEEDLWCETWPSFLRRSLWCPTGPLIAATNELYHPGASMQGSRQFVQKLNYPTLQLVM